MCSACGLYLTRSQDDGTGRHKTCPPTPDRDAYLERKRRLLPRLTHHVNRLQELEDASPVDTIRTIHDELEGR